MSRPVGYKHTKETIRKMRESSKGIKHSKETKRKIKKALKGNKYNWRGGKYQWWAKELKKINTNCCLCKSERILEMHHKDTNREHNYRENLIIICKECHEFWHHT